MPHRRTIWPLLFVVCSVAGLGAVQRPAKTGVLEPIAPLDLEQLLDTYAAGRFDEAVASVAKAGDEIGRNLRRHWMISGRRWIEANRAERSHRSLVAAAFALETEHLRAERGDWGAITSLPPCSGPCVLDWAQTQLVDRGPADAAERAWYLAAAALAGGMRDWIYLYRMPDRPELVPGLTDRAVGRFPSDSALLLERAIAAAGRFNVTTDGARMSQDGAAIDDLFLLRSSARVALREKAQATLGALTTDPIVGPEASVRLGYLNWSVGNDQAARENLGRATDAPDRDVAYLARFLLGWIALQGGDAAGAIPHLESALAARPDSQSAALALASLELQRGNASTAHHIAAASLARMKTDADPWRVFLYAHYPRLPELIATLRREVRR